MQLFNYLRGAVSAGIRGQQTYIVFAERFVTSTSRRRRRGPQTNARSPRSVREVFIECFCALALRVTKTTRSSSRSASLQWMGLNVEGEGRVGGHSGFWSGRTWSGVFESIACQFTQFSANPVPYIVSGSTLSLSLCIHILDNICVNYTASASAVGPG